MIFYLPCFYAIKILVISNEDEEQLGTEDDFDAVDCQVMFNLLLKYMQGFEKDGFTDVINVLKSYIADIKPTEQAESIILGIKHIMIDDILKRFDLGLYDPELMGIELISNEGLLHHVKTLCEYDIGYIKTSAKKEIAVYDENDCKLNKHLGYAALAYATLLNKVLWIQFFRNKWSCEKDCGFIKAVMKHCKSFDEDISMVIRGDYDQFMKFSITFDGIMEGGYENYPVAKWLTDKKFLHCKVICCYSLSNIYKTIIPDTTMKLTGAQVAEILSENQLLNDIHPKLCFLQLTTTITSLTFQIGPFIKYNRYNYKDCNDETFEAWHTKARNMEIFETEFCTFAKKYEDEINSSRAKLMKQK